ncbi:MAG TPA: coagulation factor 5/8 type-like protein, partial [Micromonosporaceae bacterium]|nr:coagulation factor 5/8 type-like protein [Micromonosporaceae bacterium]
MRKRLVAAIGVILAALVVISPPATATIAPVIAGGGSTAIDVRNSAPVLAPTAAQLSAVRAIAGTATGIRATWDDRYGTPRTLRGDGRWLTGPRAGDHVTVARAFLNDHRDAFGLSAADIAALAVTRDHQLPGTGTHVVNFAQTYAAGTGRVTAVRGGRLSVAVAGDGKVLSYAGNSVRAGELATGFTLSKLDAVIKAAGTVYTPAIQGRLAGFDVVARGPFGGESYVQQAAFVTGQGVRPAFRVLFVKSISEAWDTVIDAATGATLYRANLVAHDAEGTVYENFPGAPGGGTPVIKPFPGYATGPTTLGPNASTYANYSNFLVPADQAPRPVSPTSQFNYVYANNWGRTNGQAVPPSYALDLDPAATNLFWHHNRIHDELYGLGFTESAGNFQGGDPILGLVHAGALSGGAPTYTGRDNAYMLTLPDGIPPWSGMFLWEPINDVFEGPYSDGNFDAGIIEHEYVHGLTNRYVAAEDNSLNSHQSGSQGEGWSDWYALNYLYRNGLQNTAVLGQHVTGNAGRGIRNWSYDANPTGFGDIGYDLGGAEVHSDGEIWTTILWDMRKGLVARYGEAAGGEMAARMVTDAMPLSPADPSFVDTRDAIRSALDNRYHARADYAEIVDTVYDAFARRGLGKQASSVDGNDLDPIPSFEHLNPARNGLLKGAVVNASTGTPIANAKVMLGVFEARVTPLRKTSASGQFAAPVAGGTYSVTVQAPGFGSRTVSGITVQAGKTKSLKFSLAPNLASVANGATVVSATGGNAAKMLDDTEASSWTVAKNGNAVVRLAAPAKISSIQVSAFTTSRFEGLRDFTVQTSTDGVLWQTTLARPNAFSYEIPRPTAPDLHYQVFTLDTPVQAEYIRFWADAPQGETKANVQVAEVQVFSKTVTGIEPLPPQPPDPPVTDTGTIAVANPSVGQVDDTTGVTATAFRSTCAVPPLAVGIDGWGNQLPRSGER